MKKLSEILKLAMPAYIARITSSAALCGNKPYGNICYRIADLKEKESLITEKQTRNAIIAVHKKIHNKAYLSDYLESIGRKTTATAQIRFYRAWIKELEKEGK